MIASDSSKQKCMHKAQNDKCVTFGRPSQDPCEKKAAAKFTLKKSMRWNLGCARKRMVFSSRVFVERRSFEVRWKVRILAHAIVGQTSKPTLWGQHGGFYRASLEIFLLRIEILGYRYTLIKRAPKCWILTFGPPLHAPGSVLSSALRIRAVRQTREAMTTLS